MSIPSRRPLADRAARGGSSGVTGRFSTSGDARRLGEHDHAVAGLEHLVAPREDGATVAHDRADQRAADRHVAEAQPDVLARRLRRDVEHLVAVALEHRHLLRARIVREPHDLLRGDAARVDRHVDAGVLVDLGRDRVVDDRDREPRRPRRARASPRSGSSRRP